MSNDSEKFIARLEALLKQNKISKAKFYTDLSIGKNQILYWKSAKTLPNGNTVTRIADYFGVTVDYLLGKTDIKEKAPDQNDQVQDKNVLRIAGRDGTYIERKLTDEQMRAFRLMVEQLPEADDL